MITFRDVLNHTKSAIKHYELKNDNAFEVHIYMTLHQQNENSSCNVMLRNYHDVSLQRYSESFSRIKYSYYRFCVPSLLLAYRCLHDARRL